MNLEKNSLKITDQMKNLIDQYKELLTVDLLMVLNESSIENNNMDHKNLSELVNILNKNLLIIEKIYLDIIELYDIDKKYVSEYKSEILLSNKRISLIRNIKAEKIQMPDYKFIKLEDVPNLKILLSNLNSLYIYCKNKIIINNINDPNFRENALLTLKSDYDKKLEKSKNNIQYGFQLYDKKAKELSSFGIEHNIYNTVNDINIIAKLSDFQGIVNKSTQRIVHALNYLGKKLYYNKYSSFDPAIKSEFLKNKRSKLSAIASIVFVNNKEKQVYKNINNLLFNKDKNLLIDNLNKLNQLNINNIFLVDAHEYEVLPRFNNLHYFDEYFDTNYKRFTFNILSLNQFCLLISTLKKEQRSYTNLKIDIRDGLNICDNYSTHSLHLYKFISERIDLNKSVFIFQGCNWSSVLETFYKYGLDVSGGSGVKRHIVNPMDYTISLFLNLFSENAYRDTVISTNLVNKSLYESKFIKKNVYLYDKDLFNQKINDTIINIEESIYYNLIRYFEDPKLETDKEFLLNLKFIILNEIIFSDIILDYNNLSKYFNNNWDNLISYYDLLDTFLYVINTIDLPFLDDINTGTDNSIRNNKKLYFLNKEPSQKRSYSTSTTSSSRKLNKFKIVRSYIKLSLIKSFKLFRKLSTVSSINSLDLTDSNITTDITSNNSNLGIKYLNKNDIFYENINSLIELAKSNPVLAQSKIETEWINILMKEFNTDQTLLRSKLNFAFKKAKETININQMKRKLIKEFGEIGKLLIDEKNLFITLMIIIDSYKNSSHTMVSYQVGLNILRNIFINNINKINITKKISLFDFISLVVLNKDININDLIKFYSIDDKNITNIESIEDYPQNIDLINKQNQILISIGLVFIDIFIQEPVNMFKLNYPQDSENLTFDDFNKPLKLVLNNEYKTELFEKLIIQPKNIPMVCEPNEWGYNKFGGYLCNTKIREDIITGSVRSHKHKFNGIGKLKLYNTINYLNKIKFGINNSLLNYIKNKGDYLFKDLDEDNLYNSNISIKMADIFKNIPFYLHTHADWRGRIYTHCFYLSYQGSDLSTALLQFWSGISLTQEGVDNLYVYGATLYNHALNKESILDRIDWVKKNKYEILKMNPDFLLKAESRFQFTAFCLEIIKLEQDPNVKVCIPVFIDATCSGIQHLSAMVADSELGNLVNLTAKESKDKPKDIYQELVEPINNAINKYGLTHPEYKSLSNLYFKRDELKRPIMTQNYNVSIFGMKQQLFELLNVKNNEIKPQNEFYVNNVTQILKPYPQKEKIIGHSKEGKEILLNHKDLIKISMIIKEVIFIKYPVLKEIYNYFLIIANIMERLHLPVQWLTPTGAVITQEYKKRTKSKVRIFLHKKAKVNVILKISDKTDHRKQKDGIIPNVIHSLDSSHIINLINDLPSNFGAPILTVHDCFGTHPNLLDVLDFRLKEEFISIYIENNFLKTFHKRFLQYIKDNNYVVIKENKNQYVVIEKDPISIKKENDFISIEKLLIPKPPLKNNLDISQIIKAKYMFN